MDPKLRRFLIYTCLWVFSSSTIFLIIIFIIFSIEGVQQPFKETLSISVSFLSAVATLGAAIIAARLFQTWKTQHSYVEQIKILSQMLETISEVQVNLGAARKNEDLIQIILGLEATPNLDKLFLEQFEKIKVLENSLHKLIKWENQIYLLNNDKREKPVFNEISDEDCPLDALLKFTQNLEVNIWIVHGYLTDDFDNGHLIYEHFDIEQIEIQRLLLNILNDGAWYLSNILPTNSYLKENIINKQLKNWLHGLDQRIMKYRDSLDTLN
ncbi:hypothetical protein [Acinetobacter calcoaceticus]|uniref:hypothetical protein n=1 Tax=Acinetobacter calcoaceticus TaxID=471 RepID=UPI0030091E82